MTEETKTKVEIIEENKGLFGKVEELKMEISDAYPEQKEALNEIIGSVLDLKDGWDFDPAMLESYPEVYKLLGKDNAKKDPCAKFLVVNLRLKRCLNDIKVFKQKQK